MTMGWSLAAVVGSLAVLAAATGIVMKVIRRAGKRSIRRMRANVKMLRQRDPFAQKRDRFYQSWVTSASAANRPTGRQRKGDGGIHEG